ncbi:MAG: SDR family oxidoreductase, partial [Proteobacteria bacterium]|nr:SDR family oxidoreductase [Pseudomonadota bacterium]
NPGDILILSDEHYILENVCIVSVAGTGIGRAVAVAAAANGLTTLGLDINAAEGEKTVGMAKKAGGRMVFLKTDLTKDTDIQRAVQKAGELGNIRFLANIAGIQHIDSVENFPMETYDLMERIMLRAPFYLSKLVIPHMKKGGNWYGAIGNMASVHAHICTKNKPVYNITKFGLRALSQSISAEGEGKIRSFTVSSGFVKTPLALNQIPSQAEQRNLTTDQVITDVMMGKSRVKEMMSPIEVANLFVFGFSRFSKYLVGGDLLFDGGMTLTY